MPMCESHFPGTCTSWALKKVQKVTLGIEATCGVGDSCFASKPWRFMPALLPAPIEDSHQALLTAVEESDACAAPATAQPLLPAQYISIPYIITLESFLPPKGLFQDHHFNCEIMVRAQPLQHNHSTTHTPSLQTIALKKSLNFTTISP